VRDLLLGKQPKDFDIATNATPSEIRRLFRNCRIIGRRFKLAHIFFQGGKIIEVATFRDTSDVPETIPEENPDEIDLDEDAEVLESEIDEPDETENLEPTRTLADDNRYGTEATDALRRDLTINGLFYDISDFSIIDYVGGMADMQKRIVRIIGDPIVRIQEDPVRMMRVVRHAVKSDFRIADDALGGILDLHEMIESCPKMRVYEEIKKDLTCGYFFGIARMLASCRLLVHLLPELLRDDGHLLSDGTLCAYSLHRVDELARDGRELSPAVPLTIIALFTVSPTGSTVSSSAELAATFRSAADLRSALMHAFTGLAVPRRERESIVALAKLWWDRQRARASGKPLPKSRPRPPRDDTRDGRPNRGPRRGGRPVDPKRFENDLATIELVLGDGS